MIKYYKENDGDYLSIDTDTLHEYHGRKCYDCKFTIIPHNTTSVTDSITFKDELHHYSEVKKEQIPKDFLKELSSF